MLTEKILEKLSEFNIKENKGRGRPLDLTRFNLTDEGTFTVRCNHCRNMLSPDKFRSGQRSNGRGFIDTMCYDCRKAYAKNYTKNRNKNGKVATEKIVDVLEEEEEAESFLDFE